MRGEEACNGVHAGVCQDEVVGWLLVGISRLSWCGVAIVAFLVHTGRWAMFAVACYECVGPERMLDVGMLVDVVMQWWGLAACLAFRCHGDNCKPHPNSSPRTESGELRQ